METEVNSEGRIDREDEEEKINLSHIIQPCSHPTTEGLEARVATVVAKLVPFIREGI